MSKKDLRGASKIVVKEKKKINLKPKINKQGLRHIAFKLLKILVILIAIFLSIFLWLYIIKPAIERPISSISVTAFSNEVVIDDIKKVIDDEVQGKSIFTLNLKDLRQKIEYLDWVKKVDIIRKYPDQLYVVIDFQKPIARWAVDRLLTDDDKIFQIKNNLDYGYLPSLYASNMDRNKILNNYKIINKIIQPLNTSIKTFIFADSGSLEVSLDNGMILRLGKNNYPRKIETMLSIFKNALSDKQNDIEYVDLRYPNGIAVKFKEKNPENKI